MKDVHPQVGTSLFLDRSQGQPPIHLVRLLWTSRIQRKHRLSRSQRPQHSCNLWVVCAGHSGWVAKEGAACRHPFLPATSHLSLCAQKYTVKIGYWPQVEYWCKDKDERQLCVKQSFLWSIMTHDLSKTHKCPWRE